MDKKHKEEGPDNDFYKRWAGFNRFYKKELSKAKLLYEKIKETHKKNNNTEELKYLYRQTNEALRYLSTLRRNFKAIENDNIKKLNKWLNG